MGGKTRNQEVVALFGRFLWESMAVNSKMKLNTRFYGVKYLILPKSGVKVDLHELVILIICQLIHHFLSS